jgi:AAA family ATP:ADP antiporter
LLIRFVGLEPAQFGWIVLGLLVLWVAIARRAGFQYLVTLGDTLRQHRLSAEALRESPEDRSATQVLATELRSNDPRRIIYALDLLGERRWKDAYPSIRQLLAHPAPRVRAKAVSILRLIGDSESTPAIEGLMRDPNIDVRTEALLFLSQFAGVDPLDRIQRLGDFPDFSVQAATVVFLARSGVTSNLDAARFILERIIADRDAPGRAARLEAARLIRFVPEGFESYLSALLKDNDTQVLREAVRTASAQQNPQYVSALITLLGHTDLKESAIDALAQFGPSIRDRLSDLLADDRLPLEIRREIPDLLFMTAQRDARDILVGNLRQSDNILRFRIISSLNKLRHCYPDLELDSSIIEVVLASEIMSHCQSYQIMGRVDGHLKQQSFYLPLMKSIDHELERIFRLLKMLYPQHDLKSAFVALRSNDKVERDRGLEFIDNALKLSIRRLLVPLLDGEIGLAEKVTFANSVLGATIDSTGDALQALMKAEDPWLKSCAAHLIGVLGLKQFETEVNRWASDPDPLLSEKAQRARKRLTAAHA